MITAIFKTIRPINLFIIGLTHFLIFFFVLRNQIGTIVFPNFDIFLFSISIILITAAGYVINDYFDIYIDRINKPEKNFIGTIIHRRTAIFLHSFFNLASIIFGIYLSAKYNNWYLLISFLIFSIFLYFYSAYFKRTTFFGNFTIALISAFGTILPLLCEDMARNIYNIELTNKSIVLIYAGFAFFLTLAREIIKDIEDIKGDISKGCKTLPIKIGIKKSRNFTIFTLIIPIISLLIISIHLYNSNFILSIYSIILIFFPLIFFIILLLRSNSIKKFHNLSTLLKIIMLLGIISMIFIN